MDGMDGWMDGWDGWMDGWVGGLVDERTGMQCGSSLLDACLMGIIEPSGSETRARQSIPVSSFEG